ncbi:putative Mg2+ and Co2+ transporter, CBS domain protein [Orientia chuto str. Dubai]|uniref:Putative Mg2+ and Co2+ transporter, CBS domain protein n=1 Tax=Orientia chuto str. Dubai TaxID=1359168 RepID=A0A0F3MLV6_9RICK|nr:hypothetical protein [Candidatus Orientia mediorientalis]KJV56631.1 putative Mg2+ and Co2+ transporter, CBS domain protein [Orientia chuto str. Dubai]
MQLKPLEKKSKKRFIASCIVAIKNWILQILSSFKLMRNFKCSALYHIIQDLEVNDNKLSLREQMLLGIF